MMCSLLCLRAVGACSKVNVPLRRARLALRKNFGGIFGVALRKVDASSNWARRWGRL